MPPGAALHGRRPGLGRGVQIPGEAAAAPSHEDEAGTRQGRAS